MYHECGPVGCSGTVMEESECGSVGPPVWARPLGRWPWITLAATGSIMTLQAVSNDTCRAEGYTPEGTDHTALQPWIHNKFVCAHARTIFWELQCMFAHSRYKTLFVTAVCVSSEHTAPNGLFCFTSKWESLCVLSFFQKKHTLSKVWAVFYGVLCMWTRV